jgi:uncharacterized protein (TIGR00297 family)
MLLGLAFNAAIARWAYRKQKLTLSGTLAAFGLGVITIVWGHWTFFPLMLMFFLSSVLIRRVVSVWLKPQGIALKAHEARTHVQVFSNGGVLALLSLLFALQPHDAYIYAAGISMAAATADTWASELGALSRVEPKSLWRKLPLAHGLSGGVTPLGLWASLAGSAFVSSFSIAFFALRDGLSAAGMVLSLLMIGMGFMGSIVDSLIGEFLQAKYRNLRNELLEVASSASDQLVSGWRWMDNNIVNFVSNVIVVMVMLGLILVI